MFFIAQGAGLQDEVQDYLANKFNVETPKSKKQAKMVRNFGEITSNEEFESRCVSYKKGCAIGLLPAMTLIDYEKDNFEQHVGILKELDSEAKTHPIFYSWINTTCHPEWLKHFEIDQFQLPTVVYYYPDRQLQANLIGKFDKESIDDHSERYLKGKLPTWTPKTDLKSMKMESRDCSAPLDDGATQEDQDLQDEILREILEEQAERERK